MTYQDIAELALIIISSIGSAGAFILWLSDRLAKIWTERLLENERQKHRIELAKITTDFEKENQRVIEVVKVDLNISKERYLKGFNDKFQVYRLMIELLLKY